MNERLIETTERSISKILEDGINTTNLDHLYKLSKINHIAKEDRGASYGNYGHYDYTYGNYDNGSYNARQRDSRGRYRGHDHLERMYEDYGRYEEGRQRYGASEDTKKYLKHMLESMEDFARMLKEEASSQEEINMIRQTAQRIAQM